MFCLCIQLPHETLRGESADQTEYNCDALAGISCGHTLSVSSLSAASANAMAEGGHPTRAFRIAAADPMPADSKTPQDAKPAMGIPAANASAVAIPNVSPVK